MKWRSGLGIDDGAPLYSIEWSRICIIVSIPCYIYVLLFFVYLFVKWDRFRDVMVM